MFVIYFYGISSVRVARIVIFVVGIMFGIIFRGIIIKYIILCSVIGIREYLNKPNLRVLVFNLSHKVLQIGVSLQGIHEVLPQVAARRNSPGLPTSWERLRPEQQLKVPY